MPNYNVIKITIYRILNRILCVQIKTTKRFTNITIQALMWLLKALTEDACLASVGSLFQHFSPLNEKRFCSLAELFKGRLKSRRLILKTPCAQSTEIIIDIGG